MNLEETIQLKKHNLRLQRTNFVLREKKLAIKQMLTISLSLNFILFFIICFFIL